MSIEEDLWERAGITEKEFDDITDNLLKVYQANGDRIRYTDFEKCIRDMGYTIGKAKIIIGLCATKAMFSNIIDNWAKDRKEIQSFIRQIDKEDSNK